MKHNKLLVLLLAFCVAFAMMPMMAFAGEMDIAVTSAPAEKTNDIVILGTSDVHCGIEDGLGYAGIAQVVKDAKATNDYVAVVDAGDAIQGGVVGTLSKGEYIVEIMNAVGYDICVPGNHEFDYGMDQFLNTIVKNNKATYVSCNFMNKEGKTVFDAYKMMTFGDKKVAFVGVCTPQTLVKSTPIYFQDANGNYIYDFLADATGAKLFKQVQATVDEAKKAGADYVVAVAHLGNDADSGVWTSEALVKNTTGIDVVFDGHAHQTFTTVFKNKNGKNIKAIATGTKAANVGKITISKTGVISVENIDTTMVTAKDADTQKVVDAIKAKYETLTKKVVAKTTVDLMISDANNQRLIRSRETNMGDLCADAYKSILGTDIAVVNGGGIIANLLKGDITYGQMIEVQPFGNMACSVKVTGQQILDALEWGYRKVSNDVKDENGGFLQISGITCDINPFITSPCISDENESWAGMIEGAGRKVSNVKINGEAIDPAKEYTIGSTTYMLKSTGDGYTMFGTDKVTVIADEVAIDNQMVIDYIVKKLGGTVGEAYKEAQGRIHMLTAAEAINPVVQKLEIAEYMPTIKVTSSKKSVTLKWNACAAENVKYQVYKSTKSSKGFKRVITTSKTSYKTTKLTKGKTYYFKVIATKTIGEEAYKGHSSKVVKGKIA